MFLHTYNTHADSLSIPRSQLQKGLRPRRSIRTAMAHEIAFYAIAQKEG
jgi:hypothetical protein